MSTHTSNHRLCYVTTTTLLQIFNTAWVLERGTNIKQLMCAVFLGPTCVCSELTPKMHESQAQIKPRKTIRFPHFTFWDYPISCYNKIRQCWLRFQRPCVCSKICAFFFVHLQTCTISMKILMGPNATIKWFDLLLSGNYVFQDVYNLKYSANLIIQNNLSQLT